MGQSLFEKYGGIGSVQAIIHRFYESINREPRLARFFANVDMARLIEHQVAFFCKVMGGPDNYTGPDLKSAHARLNIDDNAFAIVANILRETLIHFHVAAEDIKTILSAVNAVKPQIVTRGKGHVLAKCSDWLDVGVAVIDLESNVILDANSMFMNCFPGSEKSPDFRLIEALNFSDELRIMLMQQGFYSLDADVAPTVGRAFTAQITFKRFAFESFTQTFLVQVFNQSRVLEKELLLKSSTKVLEGHNRKLSGQSDELKQLIRTMSHDLMNPLSVILGYASVGQAGAAKKDFSSVQLCFEKINRAAQSQKSIVEHVKLMRSIEDGKVTLELLPVPLDEIIHDAKELFEKILEDKKVSLNIDAKSLAGLMVMAEPVSVKHHVVNNIISNAIKFSHAGQTIDITATHGPNDVSLSIADHGIGIPAKIMENLFRTDQPTSRIGTNGEKGTGYGMPVVQAYMRRYGGDINVQSHTGGIEGQEPGTKVTLIFQNIR